MGKTKLHALVKDLRPSEVNRTPYVCKAVELQELLPDLKRRAFNFEDFQKLNGKAPDGTSKKYVVQIGNMYVRHSVLAVHESPEHLVKLLEPQSRGRAIKAMKRSSTGGEVIPVAGFAAAEEVHKVKSQAQSAANAVKKFKAEEARKVLASLGQQGNVGKKKKIENVKKKQQVKSGNDHGSVKSRDRKSVHDEWEVSLPTVPIKLDTVLTDESKTRPRTDDDVENDMEKVVDSDSVENQDIEAKPIHLRESNDSHSSSGEAGDSDSADNESSGEDEKMSQETPVHSNRDVIVDVEVKTASLSCKNLVKDSSHADKHASPSGEVYHGSEVELVGDKKEALSIDDMAALKAENALLKKKLAELSNEREEVNRGDDRFESLLNGQKKLTSAVETLKKDIAKCLGLLGKTTREGTCSLSKLQSAVPGDIPDDVPEDKIFVGELGSNGYITKACVAVAEKEKGAERRVQRLADALWPKCLHEYSMTGKDKFNRKLKKITDVHVTTVLNLLEAMSWKEEDEYTKVSVTRELTKYSSRKRSENVQRLEREQHREKQLAKKANNSKEGDRSGQSDSD
ncbi:hypothetical protein ONE63_001694 [Megalurothrips usitatus]|uniref:Uncharacterized protein n=1 Tax=Megalurothrips usitatus TaxID=439358 RepID=A0AAV7XCX8_9NEOP|nr:hypothetical protein ONE63_001694 [Megalurothrips usitatus]